MKHHLLTIIRQTRENFIRLVESCSPEELNAVPRGFNNNVIWNFGHIAASQQLLCYLAAGAVPIVDEKIISSYRKGTRPEGFVGLAEIEELTVLMRSTIDSLSADLDTGIFDNYKAFATSYGVELKNVADAVQFFAVHDAYHYGIASAIKKVINTNQ